MTTEIDVRDLPTAAGRELGPGPWHEVTQQQVDLFAEATGDDQWIHVDPERAAAGPFGTTIAHGYLTLSLLPLLQRELWTFTGAAMGVNYGLDKLRFPSPVKVGARVRLRVKVLDVEQRPDGSLLLKNEATVEVEGSDRPGCVAHTLSLVVPAR
ncbi:MAG: MaoC family dehydratase [Actinomycetes bacterium]